MCTVLRGQGDGDITLLPDPFWSVFTVKNLFQRLEQLGVIESTQRFNINRWNRTKWYTLNAEALAELAGSGGVADAEAAEASAMDMATSIEGQASTPIEGIESASIDGADFVPSFVSGRSSGEIPNRACESEPEAGARSPALKWVRGAAGRFPRWRRASGHRQAGMAIPELAAARNQQRRRSGAARCRSL